METLLMKNGTTMMYEGGVLQYENAPSHIAVSNSRPVTFKIDKDGNPLRYTAEDPEVKNGKYEDGEIYPPVKCYLSAHRLMDAVFTLKDTGSAFEIWPDKLMNELMFAQKKEEKRKQKIMCDQISGVTLPTQFEILDRKVMCNYTADPTVPQADWIPFPHIHRILEGFVRKSNFGPNNTLQLIKDWCKTQDAFAGLEEKKYCLRLRDTRKGARPDMKVYKFALRFTPA
jgi:hypothetical protein